MTGRKRSGERYFQNFLPFFQKAVNFPPVMNRKNLALLFTLALASSVFADPAAPAAAPVPAAPVVTPVTIVPPAPTAAAPAAPVAPALVFDAESKEYNAKVGEAAANFTFSLTNVSAEEVIITNVSTSCGCTVASLPSQPWHLAPGAHGEIKATMNLAGKQGRVTKQLTVNSSVGVKALLVHSIIPAAPAPVDAARGDREKNMELAKADRQAVFKGDCASCHVAKGVGKMGHDLFQADCNICHENTPSRAAMVPDLAQPKGPRDQNYWRSWIAHGRIGSMMPAFADTEGGPLSKEQIESLVTYLFDTFPKEPAAAAAAQPESPIPIRILKP